jgi:hypothetical protein
MLILKVLGYGNGYHGNNIKPKATARTARAVSRDNTCAENPAQ